MHGLRLIAVALAAIFTTSAVSAQVAYFSFLHNSPDPSLKVADLYVTQNSNTTKFEDIAFQTGLTLESALIFGGFPVEFVLAPSTSSSPDDGVVRKTFNPGEDLAYVVIAQGLTSTEGYVANPNGRAIAVDMVLKEIGAPPSDPSKTGVYFVHGSTDLERIDVYIKGVTPALATGLSYGDASGNMVSINRADVQIDLTRANDIAKVLASFSVNLTALGSDIVLLVPTGFYVPGDNNGSTDSLALLAVLDNGTAARIPAISGSQTARVQLVHNASEPKLTVVDVWVNGTKAINRWTYRSATPFQELPSGIPLNVVVTAANAANPNNPLFSTTIPSLRPGRSYHVIATGVTEPGFAENPGKVDTSFKLIVLDDALERSPESGKTAVRIGHFATDAPTINARNTSLGVVASGLKYLDFTPYRLFEPATDTIWIVNATEETIIKGYIVDLRGTDRAALLLASGFVDPAANKNGSPFRMILVEPSGAVRSNLIEIDSVTSSVNDYLQSLLAVGPNPASSDVTVRFDATTAGSRVDIVSMTGTVVASMPLGTEGAGSLPVAGLSAGMYTVRVVDTRGVPVVERPIIITR